MATVSCGKCQRSQLVQYKLCAALQLSPMIPKRPSHWPYFAPWSPAQLNQTWGRGDSPTEPFWRWGDLDVAPNKTTAAVLEFVIHHPRWSRYWFMQDIWWMSNMVCRGQRWFPRRSPFRIVLLRPCRLALVLDHHPICIRGWWYPPCYGHLSDFYQLACDKQLRASLSIGYWISGWWS